MMTGRPGAEEGFNWRRGSRAECWGATHSMFVVGVCMYFWCFNARAGILRALQIPQVLEGCKSAFSPQALAGTKWLLAANFRNNAQMMPQFIKQVWLLAALLPANSLYVSIYESGSEDAETGCSSSKVYGKKASWLRLLSVVLKPG